jgi:hypothetical protein
MWVLLHPGRIVIVSVNADPSDIDDPVLNSTYNQSEREEYLSGICKEAFGRHVPDVRKSDVARNALPRLFARVIRSQLETSLASRQDYKFFQLFNFRYADGAQMLTFGGVIDLKCKEDNLKTANIFDLSFIQRDMEPFEISVPPLTIREKQWLDSQDHSKLESGQLPPAFELEDVLLRNYLKYYRHYPTFHEVLL